MPEPMVLSLSTNYPRPDDANRGLFIRSRLQHVAAILPLRVVSPVTLVDYTAFRTGGYPPLRVRDENLDVLYPRWFHPPWGGMANPWFLAARLLPFLGGLRREFPFTVLDAHFGHPEGVAAALVAAALQIPFTVTLRGSEVLHARWRGRRRWMCWALRRAARVVAVASSLQKFALGLEVDPARIRTIPNGIESEVFYPRPRAETRARLGMPADRPAILTAGHLIELKGHHRAVQALAELRRRGSRAELWIVGGPGRVASFARQIREEVEKQELTEAVHFTGAVPQAELAEYMSAADIFCLASSREGWPNVVHEALGCGTPVVATHVGGVEDMLPSPEYGIMVPAGDPAALADGLGRALEARWSRDRIAAWGKARSWSQVAAETAAVLREAGESPLVNER